MAHLYDNFNEAYLALYYAYADAKTDWDNAYDHWLAWQVHFNAAEYESAQYDLARCVQRIMWAFDHLFGFGSGGVQQSLLCENIYWSAQQGGAADVDMSAILAAMLTATQPELMSFVGITDAYRQSIWNQPFNQEYYAALARGFALWE